ncbi:SDR family oxidoreductase [Frankia sp. CNm7]|uniref:SDR family oxidoreductase n=1 Tax=Frankia nepalensis TaxID=1836974 RepID=A0A937R9N0_9ACTN|nr:SDR family oxidoreductase [Frankia nepalensis]MBL7499698.1 SDR family oxidoreductase [Frankia nepalensis]MBL7513243.1 SDR family oxidoreductase [Frankia nepalensis]MBL7517783.1 SDR family oxidoreductase [Frankia nepalensis]MBL7626435.1 SDR family oxidoreductase [Frankia nepalensis]
MDVNGAVTVITGAGSGIGAALARRFAAEGARAVVVSDRDPDAAARVAAEIGGTPARTDVTDEAAVAALVERTVAEHGRIDLFCSNAGVAVGGGVEVDTGTWQDTFAVNVLAHVYAARAAVPPMLERGGGYLLNVVSAAGLLTSPGDAPYAVTKHAALALAEWLVVTYGDQGIRVSAVCPLGVATPLLLDPLRDGHAAAKVVAASGEVMRPEDVAESVIQGLAAEKFLILPHPEVGAYWAQKAADPDRWLAGVRSLARGVEAS